MTVHVAANSGCNLGCEYCYEEPDRNLKQTHIDSEYDIELIMDRLKMIKEDPEIDDIPGLHGGEPLMLRTKDIERIFKWIHENYDRGGHIQTNGSLITEEIIHIFEKYDVNVGVSADGPGELNQLRRAKNNGDEITRRMTNRTQQNIKRLVDSGVGAGMIVVLHGNNAGTDEKLEKLLKWMDWLNRMGVSGHFNPANPYQGGKEPYILSPQRIKEVYLRVWEWMKEEPYRTWNPMRRYQLNLLGFQYGNCVNTKCDVYNTSSAKLVRGDGELSGCAKTWSTVGDGSTILQGASADNKRTETVERYEMLKQTPGKFTEEVQNGEIPDQGGCMGCEYWSLCYGGCPSSGPEYRNRARLCEPKHALYKRIEEDMRRMYPGIRLVTDTDWDEETHRTVPHDIGQFAFANSDRLPVNSEPSVTQSDINMDTPQDIIENKQRGQPENPETMTKEERKQFYIERSDPDSVVVTDDGIHVDSQVRENTQPTPSSFEEKVERYKKEVDDEDHLEINYENETIHTDSGSKA